MNLCKIAGHTIDFDRLPEAPMVLDVGCRHFDFTAYILAMRPLARVIALDPDPAIERPCWLPTRVQFRNAALVHDDRKTSGYASYSTGDGNMLTDAASYYDAKMLQVPCINIADLSVIHFDLVKLDCEGSEFDILANWPGPIADQISVEFHDGHPEEDTAMRNRAVYYSELWAHLKGYKIVQHEITKQGNWYGHWDTLLTL